MAKRGTTKAEKIAAYEGLTKWRGLAELVLYDMAQGREPDLDVTRKVSDAEIEGTPRGEAVAVRVQVYRIEGALGGVAVRSMWTETMATGERSSVDVRLSTVDDIADGIESYGRTTAERAIVEAARMAREARRAAYDKMRGPEVDTGEPDEIVSALVGGS